MTDKEIQQKKEELKRKLLSGEHIELKPIRPTRYNPATGEFETCKEKVIDDIGIILPRSTLV